MVPSAASRFGRAEVAGWRSPEEARELLARARSSLALARSTGHGVLVEDLLVLTAQSVRRSLHAVLIAEGVPPPADGSVRSMLAALGDAGIPVPDRLGRAATLFPDGASGEPIHIEKYYEAVLVATEVLRFAETRVR